MNRMAVMVMGSIVVWVAIDSILFGISRLNFVYYIMYFFATPGIVALCQRWMFAKPAQKFIYWLVIVPIVSRLVTYKYIIIPIYYKKHLGDDAFYEVTHQVVTAIMQSSIYGVLLFVHFRKDWQKKRRADEKHKYLTGNM